MSDRACIELDLEQVGFQVPTKGNCVSWSKLRTQDIAHILQSRAIRPPSWMRVPTPSSTLICVKPISLMYSSFVYSGILQSNSESRSTPRMIVNLLVECFHDPKDSYHNIHSAVPLVPQLC